MEDVFTAETARAGRGEHPNISTPAIGTGAGSDPSGEPYPHAAAAAEQQTKPLPHRAELWNTQRGGLTPPVVRHEATAWRGKSVFQQRGLVWCGRLWSLTEFSLSGGHSTDSQDNAVSKPTLIPPPSLRVINVPVSSTVCRTPAACGLLFFQLCTRNALSSNQWHQ